MNFEFKYYITFSVPLDEEDEDSSLDQIEDHIQNAIYKALAEVGGEVLDIEVK